VNELTQAELRLLAENAATPCVSLYMPTHRAGDQVQQDPIRLKNLLGEAERRLAAAGLRPPEVAALLAPASELVARHTFWQNQGDGLAVLAAPDLFRYFRLPFPVEETVMVGRRFHLKPLLPLLAPDGHFYVLALSQQRVRLMEATRRTIREVDLATLPQGLAEALRYDDEQPHSTLQHRIGARSGAGGRGAERPGSYHGQGDGRDESRSDVLRYFHQIDDGLREWLGASHAPLVLAGVEYLHPIYRDANQYDHLAEQGLTGNPDDLRPADLHAQAWEIVRPIFIAEREATAEYYRKLKGSASPLASAFIEEIVPAAAYGRVEFLFLEVGAKRWGRFDANTGEVTPRAEPGPDDEDLVDLAAVQTYLNGGSVFAVTADKMPTEEHVAAIFRY
jgi:hypothetical protein